jgi:2-polyprenyl-3-methyl-5-hydroxy-6-metoxy-1,4-benzoquinol methylase
MRMNEMDDYYTDLASDYQWLFQDDVVGSEGTFGATSPGNERLLEAALEALPPGAEILDCSCGIGADAMALVRRGFAVTASDGSSSMVAEARRRSKQFGIELTVLQARWQDLRERIPGPFDLVLCLGNSIVHSASKSQMVENLRHIKQVLRPKGILVVDSRNWELLYESRPRIVTASRAIERRGIRCLSLYIWTIPDDFRTPCRAEIVLLFENENSTITHRRHVIDFTPFRHADLTDAIQAAGLTVKDDSYRVNGQFYAVSATSS